MIQQFLYSLTLIVCLTSFSSADNPLVTDVQSDEYGRYGGVLKLKGAKTDAFHVEKINGRDCLVTPDGYAFFSLGVNHIQAIWQKSNVDLFSEKFDRNWGKASQSAYADLKSWGYNTAGYGTPGPLRNKMPFMADTFLSKNSNFLPDSEFSYPDVFDPNVQSGMKAKIRKMCDGAKQNRNLIGYYWTDTPMWDLKRAQRKRGYHWVSVIRDLPSDSHGKKRYLQFLETRKEGEPQEVQDEAFLRLIAREYYSVVGAETRKLHPGALVFGERYLINDHPDVVIEEALPWIDVLAIQPGGAKFNGQLLDRLHNRFGKPILLCDHQCSFPTQQYPKTMWQQLENQHAVVEMTRTYYAETLKKPYIIGYHRCQYIDRFTPNKGVLKQGLIREDGRPYVELTQGMKQANAEAMSLFMNPAEK